MASHQSDNQDEVSQLLIDGQSACLDIPQLEQSTTHGTTASDPNETTGLPLSATEISAGLVAGPPVFRTLQTTIDILSTNCLYHKTIIDSLKPQSSEQRLDLPLDRYITESLAEGNRIVVDGHTGWSSMDKGCTCEVVGPDLVIDDTDNELDISDDHSSPDAIGNEGTEAGGDNV